IYTDLATLQADLDEWLMYYNHHRTHQGKMCCGRTPMATLLDGKGIWATLSQILCKHPFQLNGDRLGDHQNQS
ncbi:MAG: hypothetical protein SOW21_03940, partial [[Actinobacillus] rossii]|nr:hypothetical protein [[Actinobacillus] rossii]